MCHCKFRQTLALASWRTLADGVATRRAERARHPIAGRTPGPFPLAMTIGLMTVGVIVAISTIQILAGLSG